MPRRSAAFCALPFVEGLRRPADGAEPRCAANAYFSSKISSLRAVDGGVPRRVPLRTYRTSLHGMGPRGSVSFPQTGLASRILAIHNLRM